MSKNIEVLKKIIISGDLQKIPILLDDLLKDGVSPYAIFNESTDILKILGSRFENGEIFVIELIASAECIKKIFEIIKPLIKKDSFVEQKVGKLVIGANFGDIHDIGKNLVILMFEISGFEVVDLGVNVSTSKFIEAINIHKPNLLGMSALLTSTMPQQEEVIREINNLNLRSRIKIMVGGSPVTSSWANKINADGYAPDATTAVRIAKELILQQL